MSVKKTILVVEDDLAIRETMKEALEDEGYDVILAINGKEGLEKIRMSPLPALVLLDMMMPVMNGRGFLDAVQADPALAAVPVIILSADIDESKRFGSTAYMKKPADLHILLEWVKKHAH